ncbi:hypothetical protein J7T55_004946 [Diaporthe amygdali]|uniref:uncharacterized protein n=1 Tax=Phomopsis amygdali TaxID=1214568 RepID=UPI0022FE79E3|nr:uncharacterized protein J7T55_004946 [Diaporthe amygdali]KAJ0114702.1 hypothetical protein J7T55_004946 [Diaporthe amygdali]
MKSSTKKRASGDANGSGQRRKRQATTPTRLTRSMLKKLNENGGPPVELNPGLEMRPRRRSKRGLSAEGAIQDPLFFCLVDARPAKHRRESEPESIDDDRRVSEADVAAASRLAQAAIAAGLTGKTPEHLFITSERSPPGVEHPTGIVRLTKQDLREILSEVLDDVEIRRKMEPHWLARLEFLTWWARSAEEMETIKGKVRRLAERWSKDLKIEIPDDDEIPISTLESWRADIVVLGDTRDNVDAGQGLNNGEALDTGEERNGSENPEGDDNGLAAVKLLGESLALAKQDLATWLDACGGETVSIEIKRSGGARLSRSQKEAGEIEEKVRTSDIYLKYNLGQASQSIRNALDSVVREVREWKAQLQEKHADWQVGIARAEEKERMKNVENEIRRREEVQERLHQRDETHDVEAEKGDHQEAELQEETGSSTGDSGISGVEPVPAEVIFDEMEDGDDNSMAKVERSAHASEGETSPEPIRPTRSNEPLPLSPIRLTDEEMDHDVSKIDETDAEQAHVGGDNMAPSEEDEIFEADPVPKCKQPDREEEAAAEAVEETRGQEPTPWLPDKIGHDPSWRWPGRNQGDAETIPRAVTAAVEEPEETHLEDTAPAAAVAVAAEEHLDEPSPEATAHVTTSNGKDFEKPPPEATSATATALIEESKDPTPEATVAPSRTTSIEDSKGLSIENTAPAIILPMKESGELSPKDSAPAPTVNVEEIVEPLTEGNSPISTAVVKETVKPSENFTIDATDSTIIIASEEPLELFEEPTPEDTAPADSTAEEESGDSFPAIDCALPYIRSWSTTGPRGEVENTVVLARSTGDTGGIPQDNSVRDSVDATQFVSSQEGPGVVHALRYIRPQWENTFNPVEPGFSANEYSANEADDDDDEDTENVSFSLNA